MTKNYKSIVKVFLLVLLLSAGFFVSARAQAADPVLMKDLVCTTPIATKPNRLGFIDLDWSKVTNATGFTISILPAGGVCGVTPPLKTLPHVDGTPAWYSTAEMLCGLPICIQVDCCNDRCDACAIPKDENYCQGINPGCACQAGKIFDTEYGLKYKCFQPDGSIRVQLTRCAAGTDAGCSWQCKAGMTGDQHDVCGEDYEVKCGEGPQARIINDLPSYNFCSVEGALNVDTDRYLINPPGAYQLPPAGSPYGVGLESRFLYKWSCLGAPNTCFACKRAMCPSEFQDKSVADDFASMTPERLCPAGTATKPVLNSVNKRWEWDCNGNDKCTEDGKKNRNWVVEASSPKATTYGQLDHCSAKQTGCGAFNGVQITYDTWHKNGGGDFSYAAFGSGADLGDMWCLNGGKVEAVGTNLLTPFVPIHKKSGGNDTLHWQCVYEEAGVPVTCTAGLISCNQAVADKDLTQTSFDNFKKPQNIWNNLCLFGGGGQAYIKNFMPRFIQILNGGKAVDGQFAWQCRDEFGGKMDCSAKEVACKRPPAGEYLTKIDGLVLCEHGRSTKPRAQSFLRGSKIVDYWDWYCIDDFGSKAEPICEAKHLTCATPPQGESYNNWNDFGEGGEVDCADMSATQKSCIGVCNKLDERVVVTLNEQTKRWTWTCGDDACLAKVSDCARPPHGEVFEGIAGFVEKLGAGKCAWDGSSATFKCCGVCSEQSPDCKATDAEAVTVNFDQNTNKFNWTCGLNRSCEALAGVCGAADKSKHTKEYWDKAVVTSRALLCKNGDLADYKLGSGGWTWTCGAKKCAATEVKCGELQGKSYTSDSWTKKNLTDLCVGTSALADQGVMTEINSFVQVMKNFATETDDYKELLFQRRWHCVGDSATATEDRLSCVNNVVDCGIADAQRYALDNKRIKPRTSDGLYHASFDYANGVPTALRCLFGPGASNDSYDTASIRGAYTWRCLDSDYDKNKTAAQNKDSLVQCAARKDCGWAGSESTGYATVYFNENSPRNNQAAGCWTAEDIKSPDNVTDQIDKSFNLMRWIDGVKRTEVQLQRNGYDGFNHDDSNHPEDKINQTGPEQGICPSGWEVPSNLSWHRLEDSLDDGVKCEEKRFANVFGYDKQCNLAATVKSRLGYGLLSPITFAAKSGLDGPYQYMSKTFPCSPNSINPDYSLDSYNSNYCKTVSMGSTHQCLNKTLNYGNKYSASFPFSFGFLRDSVLRETTGIDDDAWCVSGADNSRTPMYHLRCVKSEPIPVKCSDPDDLNQWQRFYKEVFGLNLDLSQVQIPDNSQSNLKFLQFMPQGLTYRQLHEKEKELYKTYYDSNPNWPDYINLNLEERKTTQSYAIWHSGAHEAEATYAGRSADWIAQNKIKTMTRMEKGIFGLYVYWKCRYKVDLPQETYCTGSRIYTESVPSAGWDVTGKQFDSKSMISFEGIDWLRPRPVLGL